MKLTWIIFIGLLLLRLSWRLVRLRQKIMELEAQNETLMLRSVGAMAIAEGDPGWEKIPIDCPMLDAVKKLRQSKDGHEQQRRHRGAHRANL